MFIYYYLLSKDLLLQSNNVSLFFYLHFTYLTAYPTRAHFSTKSRTITPINNDPSPVQLSNACFTYNILTYAVFQPPVEGKVEGGGRCAGLQGARGLSAGAKL